MHFHLPKPLHGWREFVGEIAIIVIGVLIALAAENLIERWRWHEQADTANEAFRAELGYAASIAYERLIIQPCLQKQVGDLSTKLSQNSGLWKASPMELHNKSYLNILPVVYRAPTRPLPTDGWKSAIASGALNHMPSEHVRELSGIYELVGQFDAAQREEAKAASRLTPLAFNRILDDSGRTEMLAALAEVDRINSLMALDASQIIEAVRRARFKFPLAEVEVMRRETVAAQRENRGACTAALPLDLG